LDIFQKQFVTGLAEDLSNVLALESTAYELLESLLLAVLVDLVVVHLCRQVTLVAYYHDQHVFGGVLPDFTNPLLQLDLGLLGVACEHDYGRMGVALLHRSYTFKAFLPRCVPDEGLYFYFILLLCFAIIRNVFV